VPYAPLVYEKCMSFVRNARGYFAFVMASEIVSIALLTQNHFLLSKIFYLIGVVAYILILIPYLLRLFFFPSDFLEGMIEKESFFDLFTFVAGTNTLAARSLFEGFKTASFVLSFVAFAALFLAFYFFFYVFLFIEKKPLEKVVGEKGLIVVVALQSMSLTLALLSAKGLLTSPLWALLAKAVWSVGCFFYFIFITFFFSLLFFSMFWKKDFAPTYWLNMGAVAISVVAAGELVSLSDHIFYREMIPILWSIGTFWIPVLLVMGLWKHGLVKSTLSYDPTLWTIVFPLGMYTRATQIVSINTSYVELAVILPYLLWIACAVWVIVALLGIKMRYQEFRKNV
jgi:tellurite resistance protein TehA-like permease